MYIFVIRVTCSGSERSEKIELAADHKTNSTPQTSNYFDLSKKSRLHFTKGTFLKGLCSDAYIELAKFNHLKARNLSCCCRYPRKIINKKSGYTLQLQRDRHELSHFS